MMKENRTLRKPFKFLRFATIVLLITSSASYLHSAELQNHIVLNTTSKFFKGTAPGTIAFLPNALTERAAKLTWNFNVFTRDGAYRIPRQQTSWFIINHRDTNRPANTATYVAIQMAMYRETKLKEPLTISRNKGWTRRSGAINASKSLKRILQKDIGRFFTLHGQDDLSILDRYLNGSAWHAIAAEPGRDSWDRRVYWQRDINEFRSSEFRNRFVPPIPEDKHMSYQSYLIRFAVTHRVKSDRPIVFELNSLNTDHVWLQTFSPDADNFRHEYFLSIQ